MRSLEKKERKKREKRVGQRRKREEKKKRKIYFLKSDEREIYKTMGHANECPKSTC